MKRIRIALVSTALLSLTLHIQAQVPTGTPPWASLGGGPFDVVNLGNLNAHFSIAVRHKAGRVTPFAYDLSYDSSIWYPTSVSGNQTWQPVAGYGWTFPTGPGGSVTNQIITTQQQPCSPPGDMHLITHIVYGYYKYIDPTGAPHPVNAAFNWFSERTCSTAFGSGGTATAADGSNYTLTLADWTGAPTVVGPDGTVYLGTGTTSGTVTDSNGNQITVDGSGNFTDTLGTTALSISGTFPKYLKYTAPNNSLATWTVNYTAFNIKTNFGCSGVAEFTANNVQLITSIVLPDSTSYQFTYENTQGNPGYKTARLASITLPTGGSITYSYPLTTDGLHNAVNCADGSAPTSASAGGSPSLTRTLSPGGTWKYYRTQVSGNYWQTKVTTPLDPTVGNDTIIDFQQDSSTAQYGNTHNFFETQRKVYQGSSGSGTLLSTTITCWNTANPTPTNCPTASVSTVISRQTIFSYLPDTSPSSKVSKTDIQWTQYSDPSLPNEIDSYDYGTGSPGSLIQKVFNDYTTGTPIRLGDSYVKDANDNIKSSAVYVYDGTAVTPTTGTPQHGAPPACPPNCGPTQRGNLTRLSTQVSGSVTLSRTFTYYDTGMLNQATDWGTTISGGPNLTTYNYSSGSCGNSFVTLITQPLNLSQGPFVWDCNGGVLTSTTDENGQVSQTFYTGTNSLGSADANFWRPYGTQDQLNYGTSLTYPSATVSQSSMVFNSSNSVANQRTKLNQFGRPILSQTRKSPSSTNYDSTQTDYDSLGRLSKEYLPFTNTVDALCSGTCPAITTTYDALHRPLLVQDGGSTPGTITYTYTKNDVLQVIGPAPSGENTKKRQLEYDGLGRLVSVCEITSATGSGPCGQTVSQTGFATQYTYDVLGNVMGVTQNAQGSPTQTRSYSYDMVSRLISESNPESGTTSYIYDSGSGVSCAPNSPGDLLKKTDANNNWICYTYDALHRLTEVGNNNQGVTNACKRFRYDNTSGVLGARPPGINVSNTLSRLAEAETDTCASPITQASIITDEWFSYSARGELKDVYESTLHSGGYYHTTASYWANGALNTLGGVGQQATFTFGVDGEGRPKTTIQGSTNFVTNTTYNAASQPLTVSFGSGDSDSYGYDANTLRTTSYSFTVGSPAKSMVGNLTWNANGSLRQLAITDGFYSGGTQTCNFGTSSVAGYDDLGRLLSANCGSLWSQTFSYDPFGNITKQGTSQWIPGYNQANNRYVSPATYDAAGNALYDTIHSYTWNVYGRPATVDSNITLTYDAFDRMVESNTSGTYAQVEYSPVGKVALMNGQTQNKTYVRLPGGSLLFKNNAIWHTDWLGSVRLTSAVTQRTIINDQAYAPFGELYDVVQGGTDHTVFTGDTQDSVAGEYDTPNRLLHPGQGRWISPDPGGFGVVDFANPQSWNRYAYVLNNPLTTIDPLGLVGACTPPQSGQVQLLPGGVNSDGTTNCPVYGTPGFIGNSNCPPGSQLSQWATPVGTMSICTSMGGLPLSLATTLGKCPSWAPNCPSTNTNKTTATIGPSRPEQVKDHCSEHADMAALDSLLPGLAKAVNSTFVPLASTVTKEALKKGAEEAALKVVPASSFRRWVRSTLGVPMSVTAKVVKVGGYLGTTYDLYKAVTAAQEEYASCMGSYK